ncbi:hypothetical protein FBUS_03570 [Fasciolopsis buskii]|uniref:Uncharacterized protein n=1 Tax=Fasciolopsis buskii TaxID=27845 RepID=A0A8E0VFU0_9TREM|nr:hypothetical protein FBUS_03570 [Fasciolopsis buski]
MGSEFWQLFKVLTPLQRAYLATTMVHNSLGIFECLVICKSKFASTNTVVFYLTSALMALTQAMIEIHVRATAPYFLSIFVAIFLANSFYLLICLLFSRNKHTSWVCTTFLILFYGIFYAVHIDVLHVGNKAEFLRVLLFVTTLANNFVPFDSLLAMVTNRNSQCPPQWVPLTTGLLQSTLGGLHRHRMQETIMAPADALGVAVHLFGLIVELQSHYLHQ